MQVVDDLPGGACCGDVQGIADALRFALDHFDGVLVSVALYIVCNDAQGGVGGMGIVDDVFNVLIGLVFNALQRLLQEMLAVESAGDHADPGLILLGHKVAILTDKVS